MKVKRKVRVTAKPPEDTVDARWLFERIVVSMCRERGFQKLYRPEEIDVIVRGMVEDFDGCLEELGRYVEHEDWDTIDALAAQERTLRMIRGGLR